MYILSFIWILLTLLCCTLWLFVVYFCWIFLCWAQTTTNKILRSLCSSHYPKFYSVHFRHSDVVVHILQRCGTDGASLTTANSSVDFRLEGSQYSAVLWEKNAKMWWISSDVAQNKRYLAKAETDWALGNASRNRKILTNKTKWVLCRCCSVTPIVLLSSWRGNGVVARGQPASLSSHPSL